MQLGKIVGTVVSTKKDEKLEGLKLLIVQALGPDCKPTGSIVIAVDSVGAGIGEVVLTAAGSSARQTKVTEGKVVFSETVKKSIEMLSKGKKSERLFKKLSTREIEVLRYLNDGKKNKEVAQILGLDEKTISTYKLRLLAKLDVTNLVDLLKKAKDLDVI